MKNRKDPTSEESVREALDNLWKGTEMERVMKQIEQERRVARNRKMLATFLTGRLNPEFLRANTHVVALRGRSDQNNEKAVVAWAHRAIDGHPEQLDELTSEFMLDCYAELTTILLENQYL